MQEIVQNSKQTEAIHSVSTPIELLKKDFDTEYLPNLFDEIKQKVVFGNPLIKKIPKDVRTPNIHNKLFDIDNTKFAYTLMFKDDRTVKFSKIMNSVLNKVKPYHKIHNNKTVEPSTASIQLIFRMDNDKLSKPVILDFKAKSSYKEFNQAVNRSNNRILSKLDDNSFLLFMEEINKKEDKEVLSFVNQGRVNYQDLNGRLYVNAYTVNGNIIPANEYGEVDLGDKYITLNQDKLGILAELYLGDYNAQKELFNLLFQIEKIYKGKIEPFLCLGASVLCVFLEEIWGERAGFPIVYLQGATKQGKSLIQSVVMNIYGFTKRQMSVGHSTDNAIAMKCHTNNSIPICINDYDYFKAQSAQFENNVVHFYETGIRDKMYNGKDFNLQPINSTAMYSSNYLPTVKEKIFNRLLPLYFPENGIATEYIIQNFTNDIRRSRILCEVQKFSWDKVLNLIQKTEEFILSFGTFPNKDRESNNVAIAYAGLLILEYISGGYKLPYQENLLKEYCIWYQNLIEKAQSPIDNFINSLCFLIEKKYITNEQFKISLINGRIHFVFDTQDCITRYNSYCSKGGINNLILNTKTVGYDFRACEYYIDRTTCRYSDGHQASSTILDITDTPNGKYLYYKLTGDTEAVFTEKSNKKDK